MKSIFFEKLSALLQATICMSVTVATNSNTSYAHTNIVQSNCCKTQIADEDIGTTAM